MVTRFSQGLVISLAAVLLVSCGMTVRSPKDTFLTARDDFSKRLRWQDCNGASRYLVAEQKMDYLESCQGTEDLRLVHVEAQASVLAEDNRSAETVILLEYYRLPSVVVKKHRLRQQWKYRQDDPNKSGSWEITSPFPELP